MSEHKRLAAFLALATLISAGAAVPAVASPSGSPTWKVELTRNVPAPLLDDITCPSASRCLATGWGSGGSKSVLVWTGRGVWSALPAPLAVDSLIACATPVACVLIGYRSSGRDGQPVGLSVYRSSTFGRTWSKGRLPHGVTAVSGLSCPTAKACFVVGATKAAPVVMTTVDGGSDWTLKHLRSSLAMTAISCASPAFCVAVGTDVALRTSNAGKNWSVRHLPSRAGALTAVACSSARSCMAVGYYFGQKCHYPICPSGTVITSRNGGQTWSLSAVPKAYDVQFRGVACPARADCYVVGAIFGATGYASDGEIIKTTNAGRSWSKRADPSAEQGLDAVACIGPRRCWVVGSELVNLGNGTDDADSTDVGLSTILASTNRGNSWTEQALPASHEYSLEALDCPTESNCIAAGWSAADTDTTVLVASSAGKSRDSKRLTDDPDPISSLSCPRGSDRYCWAIGGGSSRNGNDNVAGSDIDASSDGGKTWTLQSDRRGIVLDGISCPTRTTCWAVGGAGPSFTPRLLVTDNGGRDWKSTAIPGQTKAMNVDTVDCISELHCVLLGETYNPATQSAVGVILSTEDGGASWSAHSVPGDAYLVESAVLPERRNLFHAGG